jgi:cholestenol Delta-isomerase
VGVHGHPYAPSGLEVPGFVPLQLSQGQIVAPYLGTSLLVVVAVWLVSGNSCRRCFFSSRTS